MLESQARIVIIGAGIVGCTTAYHLAKLGWRDIVVLDQNELYETGGSTSHAPGLMFQTNSSKMMTGFARETVELMKSFDTPAKRTLYQTGSIEVASTPARLADLYRRQGWATAYGLEGHVISPAEVQALIPLLDPAVIHGGYYVPSDADAKAINYVELLAAAARQDGAVTFHGDVPVLDLEFETRRNRISAVVTPQGKIKTELVLLCTNIWAPVLGDKVGVKIPLLAVEHLYALTEPLPELAGETREVVHPILRHQAHAMYFRQHFDAYGIGSYQHEPRLVDPYALGRRAMREFTPEHFEAAWRSTTTLLPPLSRVGLRTRFNGMFAFTIDGMPILGESPVKGFWTAVGVWVTHSGGVARAVANWLNDGETETDLREADINRFHAHETAPSFVLARCHTQYDEVYDLLHPLDQLKHPRGLRTAPYQARLEAQGGHFFASAGGEVTRWYGRSPRRLAVWGDGVRGGGGGAARHWSRIEGAEHLAVREHAGLFNLSPFTKIEVSGPQALPLLEYLAVNKIDRPAGTVVYTAFCNERGGIRADLTVTRTGEDSFLVLTGGSTGPRDLDWIRRQAEKLGYGDGVVSIVDRTSAYAGLGLWGPKARAILQSLTAADVSNQDFPYFTARPLKIGSVPAYALRLSYVGELGWEIYCPVEYGLHLWDLLWNAGQAHGLIAFGGAAFNTLRLEKGYRLWGADIHTEYHPYEAGLGWAVRLQKGDFLGRDALAHLKTQTLRRQLCCLTLDEPQAVALGKEPIMSNGQTLGYVTSAGYGYSVGKFILYGYLPLEHAAPGSRVEVAYFDRRYGATVTAEPLFDPRQSRVKA